MAPCYRLVDVVCAQALSLGLGERWEKVKDAYAHANRALGDIVKVTPSSKVRQNPSAVQQPLQRS